MSKAKKQKRPTWFKLFHHHRALFDSVPDEVAGKAIKAAFAYFDDGECPRDLEPIAFAVFSTIKPYIDESVEDYQKAVENGKNGADARWG